MLASELLPIGSVVRLKGAERALMIIGIKVSTEDGRKNDYVSVVYPEGYIARDIFFKFDHSDIDEIYSEGYVNDVHRRFRDEVDSVMGDNQE